MGTQFTGKHRESPFTTASEEGQSTGQEAVAFRRRNELPGIEVRTVRNSTRPWRFYSTEFEFLAPTVWQGEVWHRRRNTVIEPGMVLCAHPSEVFLVRRVITPGTTSSLMIDRCVLQEYAAECKKTPANLELRPFARMSERLRRRLFTVMDLVRPGPSALEIQTALVELITNVMDELVDESVRPPRLDSDWQAAERVRECLHQDASSNVDLSTLAEQTGLSRFQALRMFKRRFGLPPHTYQLRVRLGLAQKSLREGLQPAQVAAKYGFVDQSHLTRHFKRLLGVTPAQYARVALRRDDSLCA